MREKEERGKQNNKNSQIPPSAPYTPSGIPSTPLPRHLSAGGDTAQVVCFNSEYPSLGSSDGV